LACQYTAIPMMASAVFCGLWESWAFIVAGTSALLVTSTNVFLPLFCNLIPAIVVVKGHPYNVVTMLDGYASPLFLDSSQLCVGAMLVNRWRDSRDPSAVLSTRAKLLRATVLIAVGSLPIVLTLAKRALLHFAG
jgi:hypothetical protein